MKLTNRAMAQLDVSFKQACEKAGVYPSRQQYRKFKWRRGAAFKALDTGLGNQVLAK